MALACSPGQAAGPLFPDGDYKRYLSSEQPEEEIMAAGNPLNQHFTAMDKHFTAIKLFLR